MTRLTQDDIATQLRKDLSPEHREKALRIGRIHYASAGAVIGTKVSEDRKQNFFSCSC